MREGRILRVVRTSGLLDSNSRCPGFHNNDDDDDDTTMFVSL